LEDGHTCLEYKQSQVRENQRWGGGGRRWELVGLGVWLGHGGWHGTEVLRVFWVDCLRVDKRKGSFSLDLGSPVCRCRCDGRACGDYRGRDPV